MTDSSIDLVVAGAGGGLVAALRGAQLGLDVLVVEASPHYRRGNNTSMSTAMIPGAGSRWQRAAGITDSPELFVRDVLAKTHGEGDERVALALGQVSARLVEWLADDVDMPIELVTDFHYPGHSVDRCHTVPGRHGSVLLGHLAHQVSRSDRITMMVPARLTGVDVDGSGAVAAAVVEHADGAVERVPTRHVLLATNGYGADPALVGEHIPEIAKAVYHGSEMSRGDALRIGAGVGAATGFLDAYQGHAALAKRSATLVGWATIMHGAVMVNLEGRRFGDETTGYSEYAAVLAAQPGAEGWIILDKRIHELCLRFIDFQQTDQSGAIVWADSVDELAEVTHLPADALRAELADAEQAATSGQPDRFGRSVFGDPLRPPYAAVQVIPALFHTQGGLVVDEHARVMTAQDTPVHGLYASGGAAAGISGHGAAGYLAGNGLLPALGLAFLAAETAAGSSRPGSDSPGTEEIP